MARCERQTEKSGASVSSRHGVVSHEMQIDDIDGLMRALWSAENVIVTVAGETWYSGKANG